MKVAVIQSASPLVTGNYDFTDSTGAAPSNDFVGALFWEGVAVNSFNTDSMRFSFGACDKYGNELSLGFAAQDSAIGAAGRASLSVVNCLSMPSNSSGVVAPIANFSSALTNGVRLTLSSAPPSARLTDCALISGSDVQMECGSVQFVSGDTNKTITFAHLTGEADIILLLTASEQTSGDTSAAGGSIGWYERTGGNMASSTFRIVTGANPTDIIGWCSSTHTAEILSSTALLAHQTVDTFSSSGFRIHLSANPAVASLVGWVAIRGISQQIQTLSQVLALPTSTGNTALVTGMEGPGPMCVLAMPGRFQAKDTIENNDQAGHVGMCIAATPDRSASSQASATATFQYNVATSVAHNKNTLNRFMSTQADAGTDVIVGTVQSWDTGGITVNYTAVNASAIYAPVLAFGMPAPYTAGSFAYTGQAVTFTTSNLSNNFLLAASGTYNYSIAPSSSALVMNADVGTFPYIGSSAFLVLAPQDTVFAAAAGVYSILAEDITFTLVIPIPPAPGTFPSVIGMILREAENTLQQAGALVPSSIGYFGSWPITVLSVQSSAAVGTTTQPGVVVAQAPIPGDPVIANAPIVLTMTELPVGFVYPATNLTSS